MVTKSTPPTLTIHTDCLFDAKQKAFLSNVSLTANRETGLITRVYRRPQTSIHSSTPPSSPDDDGGDTIDLRGRTVLPGLVDAHTHLFLHSYAETPAVHQMRDESLVERIVRAAHHCRAALLAGYTTYRDLGTEGAGSADAGLRDCVNRGLAPGPRILCATEALASSGGYAVRTEDAMGPGGPRICDPCDGPVGCRAGVRRRLAAGADVVKFYADYRKRQLRFPPALWPGCPEIAFPPEGDGWMGGRNPNCLLFTQEEMDAMVEEARSARAPVAAHAASAEGVRMAARAGVTSVEHGFEMVVEGSEALSTMEKMGTIFVPTLAVAECRVPDMKPLLELAKRAFDSGVKLAAGGDTGAFSHGENVREMELLLAAGIPLEEVLTAATLHGWEACGGEWCGRKFGWIEEGCAADLVALGGDLRKDVGALRNVEFVMKDARVWKKDGMAVGMW